MLPTRPTGAAEFSTIVVAEEGEPASWVRNQAVELVRSGIFVPFVWRTHGTDEADPSAELVTPQGISTGRMVAMLAERRGSKPFFRVIRLVLPGAPAPSVDALTRRIVSLYPFGTYRLLTLLVPSEDQPVLDEFGNWVEGLPTIDTSSVGREWLTLVASPEDLSPSGPLPVELDEKLVAHATAALGTTGALWSVQHGKGPFDDRDAEGDAKSAYLLQCTSRSLVADRAVDTAVNRALHLDEFVGRTVVSDGEPLPVCGDATAIDRMERAAHEFLTVTEAFRFVPTEQRGQVRATYVGAREMLGAVVRFVTTVLPRFIYRDLRLLAWRLGSAVSERINRRVFGSQSRMVFSLVQMGEVGDDAANDFVQGESAEEVIDRWVALHRDVFAGAPLTEAWKQTCHLSLSLLDGGPMPAGLSVGLKEANARTIVTDSVRVFGPLIGPELLDEDMLRDYPDMAERLRSGDVIGLEGVVGELRPLPTGEEPTTEIAAARRRRAKRLAFAAVVAVVGVGVLVWQSPLPSPWNTVATAALGAVAVGSVVALVGRQVLRLIRWLVSLAGRAARWLRKKLRRSTDPDAAASAKHEVPAAIADDQGGTTTAATAAEGEQGPTGGLVHEVDQVSVDDSGDASAEEEIAADVEDDEADDEADAAAAKLAELEHLLHELEVSFVGRVARAIHDARTEAARQVDDYREELVTLFGTVSDPDHRPSLLRRMVSGVSRRLWSITRFVLVVAAVGLLLVTPLAPVVLVIVVVVLVVVVVAKAIGYFRRRWQEWVRADDPEAEGRWLGRCVTSAVQQEAQLGRAYEILVEWNSILRTVADEPFGTPAVPSERAASLALQPLNGHQVGHGVVDEAAVIRMRSRLQRSIMGPGWLGEVLDDLVASCAEQYGFRYDLDDDDQVDPYRDQSIGATQRHRSPRRELSRFVADPASRFAVRAERTRHCHRLLANQGPDELVPGIVGLPQIEGVASSFLLDGVACLQQPLLRTALVRSQANDGAMPTHVMVWTNHLGARERDSVPEASALSGILGRDQPVNSAEPDEAADPVVHQSVVDDQTLLFQVVGIGISRKFDLVDVAVLTDGEKGHAQVDVRALEPTSAAVSSPTVLSDSLVEENRRREVLPLDDFPPGSIVSAATVVTPVPHHDSYAFMFADESGPYRWPIEEPIEFAIRKVGGPGDAISLVRDCLQQIADVSGLTFRFQGLTDSFPGFDAQSDSGCLWIGWVYPDEDLSGSYNRADVAGMGGAAYRMGPSGLPMLVPRLATVRAELSLAPGFAPNGVGTVLLHELGHAMNLDHVDDPGQLMYPVAGGQVGFGPGDRYGLWLLGLGRQRA